MNSSFTTILRITLGLGLLLFGAHKLYPFLPIYDMPIAAANFVESLQNTGYIYYLIAGLEIGIGLLLLLKKWVPFALVLLAPLSVNILLFHLFLDVSDIIIAILIILLNAILMVRYWPSFKSLFQ